VLLAGKNTSPFISFGPPAKTILELKCSASASRQRLHLDKSCKPVKELPLVCIGVVQTLIFALQLWVFGRQAKRLRQTVEAAKEQSGDMKESIKQATRSAAAMEQFSAAAVVSSQAATETVATVKDSMGRQLRAYLCVNFSSAGFQNPEAKFLFGVSLNLLNVGFTPGYKVSFRAHVDVLDFPLPNNFAFPLPNISAGSESTLGHGQSLIMGGTVNRLYSEEEAAEIRNGQTKRLYIYGTASYEDAYRIQRYTNFCVSVIWLGDKGSMGVYTKRHNDAD
jgi:hypothetical protein